jgi:hypothetical protein
MGYGILGSKFLTPITPRAEFLLGLCFCDHCIKAAGDKKEGEQFRAGVAAFLEDELPRMPTVKDSGPVNEDWLNTAFDSRLQHYLACRARSATSLYEEVVGRIRVQGAIKVESDRASKASIAQDGLIAERVNAITDRQGIGVPERVDQVKPHRQGLAADKELLANIQPEHLSSEARAKETVGKALAAGVDGFTFYNYGLIRLEQLNWIGKSLPST